MKKVYSHTLALCPDCQTKANARIVEHDMQVYLEKFCPEHGVSTALICSDTQWYRESMDYVKPGRKPLATAVNEYVGCPDSCGLCPQHQQHTCLPVVEITTACDMHCPICLKDLSKPFHMSVSEFDHILDRLFEYEGAVQVLNLSGGEPTLHPELDKMLHLARDKDVVQTSVSTNGNRFLHDKELRELFIETDTIASLQFDGFASETYRYLRGKDLAERKLQIIELLEGEEIKYSLAATIVKGVNDQEITDIVDFFFESQALSLMFQPAAFTGQAANLASNDRRMTIPDVVREIEKSRFVSKGDFNPLPCGHFSCFALAYYFFIEGEEYLSLKEFLGKEDYLEIISNRTLPGLDRDGYSMLKAKIYEFWSAADAGSTSERVLKRIRSILKEMNAAAFAPKRALGLGTTSIKSVFIHQFMDVHTLDFGRLIKCCNHYPQPDGRLVPMCAFNVFEQ